MQFSVLILAAADSVSFDSLVFWILLFTAIFWYLIRRLLKTTAPAPEATASERGEKVAGSPSVASPGILPPAQKEPKPVTEKSTSPAAKTPKTSTAKSNEEDAARTIETASTEEATSQFQAEIDSGKARFDDAYGVVYNDAPEKPDDLKKIKGVAKVLEGKLNAHGVYTYRQIAFWTAPATKEFSKLLTNFKDRIYRDNWIAQAKELHEAKYGEKL